MFKHSLSILKSQAMECGQDSRIEELEDLTLALFDF